METENNKKRWEMPAPLPAVETEGRGLMPADLQEFAQMVLNDPIIMKEFRRSREQKIYTKEEMASGQWPMRCYARQYLNQKKVNWRWDIYLLIAYQLVNAVEDRAMVSVYSEDALQMIEKYSKTLKPPRDSGI